MDEIIKPCTCPERDIDLAWYGAHMCMDGKRIAPEDFYVEPLSEDINAEQHEALKRERAEALDRIKDQSHGG